MMTMNEVFVRRDLIDPAKLRGLCVPYDLAGLAQAFSHVGVIVVTGFLLWSLRSTIWAVPLSVVLGIVLNFLYAGQHELSHWTVFRTAGLNEWLGRAFGFVVFYPRTFDQIQHIAHHRFTLYTLAAHRALFVGHCDGTLLACVASSRVDPGSAPASGWIRLDRCRFRGASELERRVAHHAFPGVPFHRLRQLHHAIFDLRGTAPPSMSYPGFLCATLRAFSGGLIKYCAAD